MAFQRGAIQPKVSRLEGGRRETICLGVDRVTSTPIQLVHLVVTVGFDRASNNSSDSDTIPNGNLLTSRSKFATH
jgi:hypothetical protein